MLFFNIMNLYSRGFNCIHLEEDIHVIIQSQQLIEIILLMVFVRIMKVLQIDEF